MYIDTKHSAFPANDLLVELSIELEELKSRFKALMMGDTSNSEVRSVFIQINKIECRLNALQWDGN